MADKVREIIKAVVHRVLTSTDVRLTFQMTAVGRQNTAAGDVPDPGNGTVPCMNA